MSYQLPSHIPSNFGYCSSCSMPKSKVETLRLKLSKVDDKIKEFLEQHNYCHNSIPYGTVQYGRTVPVPIRSRVRILNGGRDPHPSGAAGGNCASRSELGACNPASAQAAAAWQLLAFEACASGSAALHVAGSRSHFSGS